MSQQVLSNIKIPMHIRGRLCQAIVANIALWGSESWALKEEDRSKLETFHHNCLLRMCRLTMWDVAEHRITNETVKMTAGNSPTMESMVFNKSTSLRETTADRAPYLRYHSLKSWL
jgi:hypothetical protein